MLLLKLKISEQVHQGDLTGLVAFCEEHPKTKAIVVSQDKHARLLKKDEKTISIMPWKQFLADLWEGKII